MAYFFQTRLKQKTVVARYTNYPLVSIASQNLFFDSSKLTPQNGMAYFFQTHPNQKTVVARYTNYPLISIPSQNRFLIRAS